jgi:hypothetical protein
MFVVSKTPTYFWPVTLETPKSGGGFEKETFEVEFKRLPTSEVKKMFANDSEKKMTDSDFCKDNVVGWKDVKSSDGDLLPFSASNLEAILEIPTVDRRIVEAFLESLAGSRLKN